MDVEISFSGHLIRKLVLCSIPELILRPLKLCFNEILINLAILSLPRCFLSELTIYRTQRFIRKRPIEEARFKTFVTLSVRGRYKLHLITSVSETSESRTGMHYGPTTPQHPRQTPPRYSTAVSIGQSCTCFFSLLPWPHDKESS
jgi:hypothetical protein